MAAQTRSLSLFDTNPAELPPALPNQTQWGQYMTVRWAAEAIMQQNPHVAARPGEKYLEPSCGRGAWLHAIPNQYEAIGIEIDPVLAKIAQEDTGRQIMVGDYTQFHLDFEPTTIVGNPPFDSTTIASFIRRSHELLPANGRIGFVLPAHTFSFASTTANVLRGFEASINVLPRDLYPRLSFPLIFANLTKSTTSRLIGFLLFEEALAIRSMRSQYRAILENGRKPIWREVLDMALTALGGEGTWPQIYAVVENFRPTPTRWWRDALRREGGEHCESLGTGKIRKIT